MDSAYFLTNIDITMDWGHTFTIAEIYIKFQQKKEYYSWNFYNLRLEFPIKHSEINL